MHNFTPEEKELIVNTPITIECFDIDKIAYSSDKGSIETRIERLESIRTLCQLYRGEEIEGLSSEATQNFETSFNELVAMLPNSYKVVKL